VLAGCSGFPNNHIPYPINAGKGYDTIKAFFQANLPCNAEVHNNFHAMIVINGKDHCRKKPLCSGCPLSGHCKKGNNLRFVADEGEAVKRLSE